MATFTSATQRVLLAGGFALAVAAAPLVTILSAASGPATAVATCPNGEVINPTTGQCHAAPPFNPIDPEKAKLQTGGLTSAQEGNIGTLPEVNGIPCTGAHGGGGDTGQCIGLEENAIPKPKQPVLPPAQPVLPPG